MKKLTLAALTLALAAAAPAEAQMRPFTIGIQGGPSLTRGDFAEEASTGYNVQFSVGLGIPLLPVAARGDFVWQEFSDEEDGRFRQIGGMANAILRLPLPLISPYALGGLGLFQNTEPDADHGGHTHEGGSETTTGWGLGLGVQFGFMGLGAVAEARYLQAGEFRSIPLSVGIRF